MLSVVCQSALFVVGHLEIVDSFGEAFEESGNFLGAPTVPKIPKGWVRGISWVRALPLRGGE